MTSTPQQPLEHGARSSIDRVARALAERGLVLQWNGQRQFMAQCPAHEERTGSLSVSWSGGARGGKALLHCHGCQAPAQEIAEALGLTMADLFDEPLPAWEPDKTRVGRSRQQRKGGQRRGRTGPVPKPIVVPEREPAIPEEDHSWVLVETYPYFDADGRRVEEVMREECTSCELGRHKQFRQQFFTANSSRPRKRKPEDFIPVLYRHPQVLAAVAAAQPVWLLEGEKDVATAEALGLVATTNAQGAKSFAPELVEALRGAHVRVILDRDDAGWNRGVALHEQLAGVAASVQFFLPATTEAKSDFTDHVDAGHGVEDLLLVHHLEVEAWAVLGRVRTWQAKVEQALAEVEAQHQLHLQVKQAGKAPRKAAEHLRFAERWATESEIRFEGLVDQVHQVEDLVMRSGTEWAAVALELAEDARGRSRVAARAAHELVRFPVPPLLHDPTPAPPPEDAAAKSPTEALDPHDQTPPDEQAAGSPPADLAARSAGRGAEAAPADGGTTFKQAHSGVAIDQPIFRVVDRNIVMVDRNGRRGKYEDVDDNTENLKLVLGLDVRIHEMEYLEDDDAVDVEQPQLMGRESSDDVAIAPAAPPVLSAVVVGYTHPDSGELMRMRITADQWRDGSWLESLPGPPDYDPKPAGLQQVRRAIKAVSGEIRSTVRHRWTGWRQDEAGQWMFVHARGAISATGTVPAPVLLTGPLARYNLPDPTSHAGRLREAFMNSSGGWLSQMPTRVAAPLLGHTYRSALGPNPWVLVMVGSPGSYKTSLASLAMHHWGELWDRNRPATSMSGNGSTANANRILLNWAKDTLFWADDVAPTKDWGLAQRMLEEFVRTVHNAESRIRAERDGQGVLEGTPPRASAMVTSEVMPRPGSARERMLVVPIRKEEIELSQLIDQSLPEARHQRAMLMSSLIQWLASDLLGHRDRNAQQARDYAEKLRERGVATRDADAIAETWGGWLLMTEFLVEAGALSAEEVEAILAQVEVGLDASMDNAADPDIPGRAGLRVREMIAHALRTGMAFVDDVRTGEEPEWPLASRLGWRRQIMSTDEFGTTKYRSESRGLKLGWVMTDPDEFREGERCRQLYLESTALEQILQLVGKQMADGLNIDRGTATRALHDEGILIGEARKDTTPRLTVKRKIHCEERSARVTALRLDLVLDDEPEDEPPLPGIDPGDGSSGGPGGGNQDGPGLPGSTPAPADLFSTSSGTAPASVDDPQQNPVASTAPTSTAELATSQPPPEEETIVSSYPDAEGHEATLTHAPEGESRPCVTCGRRCAITFEGLYLHIPCWMASTAASRHAATSPAPSTPAQPPAAQPPAARPTTAPAEQPAKQPRQTKAKAPVRAAVKSAGGFAGPAAVLGAGGMVWLPDGSGVELPSPPAHVGDVVALVDELKLGTQVTGRWSEPGQVWVTAAALAEAGIEIPTDLPADPRLRSDEVKKLTSQSTFLTDALEAGWRVGGSGDALGSWTRVWRDGQQGRAAWVALLPAMDDQLPVLVDEPDSSTLARRLKLFADALHAPWSMSPSTTGLDLMVTLRAKDRDKVFAPSAEIPPSSIATLEQEIEWSRKPTSEESKLAWVHAYDRGGSYAAGLAGLELGIGDPTHHAEGTAFVKRLPGYWRIEVPEAGDWRVPHPLNPRGRMPAQPVWVTTPTLEFAVEQGFAPEVLEAYTWPEHARILDPWYERIRDARTGLDVDDQDAQAARDLLKVVYTHSIGMMGSEVHMKGRRTYAPERRHHIVAKARSNILRRIQQIGRDAEATGGWAWPVAVTKDTLLYVSDEPDPVKAWPGKPEQLGRGFGQFKPEGSAPLADQLKFLDGNAYRGKSELTAPDGSSAQARAGSE